MKSLKTIQTIVKIAKIVSKVLFICCIVGLCISALGLICTALFGDEIISASGLTLHLSALEADHELTLAELFCLYSVTIIMLGAYALVLRFAHKYCDNELKAGTPFTVEGAKELNALGILSLAVFFSMNIVVSIIIKVCETFNEGEMFFKFDSFGSIWLGLSLMVLALVFRYGAEREKELASYQPGGMGMYQSYDYRGDSYYNGGNGGEGDRN